MKRKHLKCRMLYVLVILTLVSCNIGCSDKEAKTITHWNRAKEFIEKREFKDAVIELKNVIQLDTRSDDAYLELGKTYMELAEPNNAYHSISKAISINPHNFQAHLELGRLFLLAGLKKEAKSQANLILEESPDNVDALNLLSDVEILQSDFDAAIKALEKVAFIDPRHIKTRLALARLYIQRGDLDRADNAIQNAAAIDPSLNKLIQESDSTYHSIPVLARHYENQKRWDDAEQMYLKTVESYPDDKVVPLMELSAFYTRIKSFEKALATTKRASAIKKNDTNILIYTAQNYLDLNRTREAEEIVHQILKQNARHVEANYLKGIVDLLNKDFDSALEQFDGVIHEMPKNAAIFYYRGLCRLWKGDIKGAQEDILQAVELNPNLIDARLVLAKTYLRNSRKGNLSLIQRQLDYVLKQTPNHLEALMLLGSLKIEAKNLESATKAFKKVIEIYPDHAPAYVELGFINFRTRRQEEAIKLFKKSLEIDPFQASALKVIVDDYLKKKDFDSALKLCEAYDGKVENNKVYAAVIEYLKGRIWRVKGEIERARKHFKTSIQLDPDLLNAHMALTEMYLKEKKIEQVITHYEDILSGNPDFLLGYMTLGFIYDRQGEKKTAEDYYRKALEIKNDFAPAANNLAWLLVKTGTNIDEAFRLAHIAKESMPHDPNVLDTLGWTYYLMGYFGMATSLLEESVSRMPDNTISNYHLGKAYYKYENYENAKKYLEKALKLDPNFLEADDARKILEEIIAIETDDSPQGPTPSPESQPADTISDQGYQKDH